MLPLITGIILALFLSVFLFYSSITIKHAARFRYLSRRTVYLTMCFVALSTLLLTLALISYGLIFFN